VLSLGRDIPNGQEKLAAQSETNDLNGLSSPVETKNFFKKRLSQIDLGISSCSNLIKNTQKISSKKSFFREGVFNIYLNITDKKY